MSETVANASGQTKEGWQRVSPMAMFSFTHLSPISLLYVGFMLYMFAKMTIGMIALTLAGLSIVLVLVGLLFWINFGYQIGADGIRIRRGVVNKSQVFIRYSRVQGIELTRSLLYRAFGLVLAKLDTAGAAKQEGTLPGITPELAELLQEKVKAAKLEVPVESKVAPEARPEASATSVDRFETKLLLRLEAPEIIRIGLTSSHVILFLGFMLAFIEPAINLGMSAFLPDWALEKGIDAWRTVGTGALVSLAIGVTITTIIAMFAGSLLSAFLRFYNFTLTQNDQQFRTNAGLFTVTEQSVHQSKVQTMTVRQSFLRRFLNRVAIDLRQASAALGGKRQKQKTDHSKLLIPLTSPSLVQTVRDFALAGRGEDLEIERDSAQFVAISRRFIRARTIMIGVLPVLAALPYGIFGLISAGWLIFGATVWIALTFWLVCLRYRRWGVQAGKDAVAVRHGFLGHQITCFADEKVQSIEINAHLLQRRAGVTNLTIHLASEKVTIPYLPFESANDLRNYLLYKIESSNAQTI